MAPHEFCYLRRKCSDRKKASSVTSIVRVCLCSIIYYCAQSCWQFVWWSL